MEAVKEPVRLLDIEKELAGPGREEALARYDATLAALDARMEAALKQGLAPEEFQRVQAMKEANTVARKILRLTVRVDGNGAENVTAR